MARYQGLSGATTTALLLALVGVASCDRPGTTGPVTRITFLTRRPPLCRMHAARMPSTSRMKCAT